MNLSHSLKYGRRVLDYKNRYNSSGSMFLETDLLLYIFGMLLTSINSEALVWMTMLMMMMMMMIKGR
jgi:hypothetical protein